jgi:hypothetical protein
MGDGGHCDCSARNLNRWKRFAGRARTPVRKSWPRRAKSRAGCKDRALFSSSTARNSGSSSFRLLAKPVRVVFVAELATVHRLPLDPLNKAHLFQVGDVTLHLLSAEAHAAPQALFQAGFNETYRYAH